MMTINLSEFFSNPSAVEDFTVEPSFDTLVLKRNSYPVASKESFVIHAARVENKIRLKGSTAVDLFIPCDRCLEEVINHFPIRIDLSIITDEKSDGIEDDERSFMDGCILDVDKLITNEIVVALPTKVLCKEDCRGLCPVCGTNLNHGDCGCDRHVADPRMAAIQDIFKNFGQ